MDGYLQDTLHGVLNCRCKGNCILKSLHVDKVEDETAFITVEPYDDAFNQSNVEETIEKIKRLLYKRREKIWNRLGVGNVSVTVFDEWTMKDSLTLSKKKDEVHSVVN